MLGPYLKCNQTHLSGKIYSRIMIGNTYTQCGNEIRGMILFCDLSEPCDLIVVKSCLCMFQLAPFAILTH
jgi:hypothetical protein